MLPTAAGAWFATTVTVKVWVAFRLALSLAVTVTVDDPTATPLTVRVAFDTLTVALPIAEELAV